MQTILQRYDKSLEDLGAPGIVGGTAEENNRLWSEHVKDETWRLGFLRLVEETMNSYPAGVQAHIQRVCFTIEGTPIQGFPPYIKLGHRHARGGLVFKNYYLRDSHHGTRAACMWCGALEAECGVHLAECEALPPDLAPKLHETLVLILHQDRGQQPPPAPIAAATVLTDDERHHALECLARLNWEGMKEATLLRVLRFTGILINTYRRAWQPQGEESPHNNPIPRIESVPSRV